jgi:hypothetical protein
MSASNTPMPVLGTSTIIAQGIAPMQARILDGLTDPLISVPKLCSMGYKMIFHSTGVDVIDPTGNISCQGYREPGEGGLYRIPLENDHALIVTEGSIDEIISPEFQQELDESESKILYMPNMSTYYGGISFRNKAERVAFYHAALGFPTTSCLVNALRNHLRLPGIDADDVIKCAPKTEATSKGHLRQHLKGVNSSKPKQHQQTQATEPLAVSEGGNQASQATEPSPTSEGANKTTPNTSEALVNRASIPGVETYTGNINENAEEWYAFTLGTISADSTGSFPVKSVNSDIAVHVTYIASCNHIMMTPIKSKADVNDILIRKYTEAVRLGHRVKVILTDNEISKNAEAFFAKVKVTTRRVEPYNHRANDAERHIQTAKAHIIATIAGRDAECPIENWDKAVAHAELTLGLLRKGKANQSAWQSYHGNAYDFAANPIAPWGVKVQAFVPKPIRLSWGYRSRTMFYMGPANYRSHQLRGLGDKTTTVRQQVVFMSPDIVYPKYTAKEELIARIADLTTALNNKGEPPDLTLAQSLEAYSAAFMHSDKDETMNLLEATVPDDAGIGPITWISSPIDFDKSAERFFPEVTKHQTTPQPPSKALKTPQNCKNLTVLKKH